MNVRHTLRILYAALVLASTAQHVEAQTPRGPAGTEIIVGTTHDLSGPAAQLGKQAISAMQMRVDEINEEGGINGRKLRLIVSDSASDPKRAALAAEKMVHQDKIFAMVGHYGASQTIATFPTLLDNNVLSFFPMTATREVFEPQHRLKYSYTAPFFDQMRLAAPRMVKDRSATRVCVLYQDDEFGLEMMRGGEAGLATLKMNYVERTTYKRGATDFSSQIARLKAANCELVVLGTILRETIAAMAEARKMGFSPVFFGGSGVYFDTTHKLGGAAVEGLYATMTTEIPYPDTSPPAVKQWITKYKARVGEDPTVFSAYAYMVVDAFAKTARKAGPNLNTDTFIAALDSSSFPVDFLGNPPMSFSATKRLGNSAWRISRIENGRWKVIVDYQ